MVRFLLVVGIILLAAPAPATEAGWALLRDGGQVVLMRHAKAPGSGDPASFDIGSCATQRNLSDRGRQQARRIGALFQARAAPVEQVLTSRYCRARDTAVLAFGAKLVEPFEALDIAPDDDAMARHREAILSRIGAYSGSGNLVMVTHLEIIEALTGGRAREGEAIILSKQGENLRPAARITFN